MMVCCGWRGDYTHLPVACPFVKSFLGPAKRGWRRVGAGSPQALQDIRDLSAEPRAVLPSNAKNILYNHFSVKCFPNYHNP